MTADELHPYVCEVEVLDANTRSHYGPHVKLRFADADQVKQFRKGQRLQIVCVEVGDDEEMVPETRVRPIQRKPYKLSQIAGMMCHDEWFWRFVNDRYGEQITNPDDAAAWVRQACGVMSRSELDSNDVAGETWRRLLGEYDAWRSH